MRFELSSPRALRSTPPLEHALQELAVYTQTMTAHGTSQHSVTCGCLSCCLQKRSQSDGTLKVSRFTDLLCPESGGWCCVRVLSSRFDAATLFRSTSHSSLLTPCNTTRLRGTKAGSSCACTASSGFAEKRYSNFSRHEIRCQRIGVACGIPRLAHASTRIANDPTPARHGEMWWQDRRCTACKILQGTSNAWGSKGPRLTSAEDPVGAVTAALPKIPKSRHQPCRI